MCLGWPHSWNSFTEALTHTHTHNTHILSLKHSHTTHFHWSTHTHTHSFTEALTHSHTHTLFHWSTVQWKFLNAKLASLSHSSCIVKRICFRRSKWAQLSALLPYCYNNFACSLLLQTLWVFISLVPRSLPDFISQLWRKTALSLCGHQLCQDDRPFSPQLER